MSEELLKKYYNLEQLDEVLLAIANATGLLINESTKRLGEQNPNYANEELIENLMKADHAIMERFCKIITQRDEEVTRKAGVKTREMFGV